MIREVSHVWSLQCTLKVARGFKQATWEQQNLGSDWADAYATLRLCSAHMLLFIPPLLKKWGVYWFTSVRGSVRPSVRPSFRPSFRNSVTLFRQRYLHNRLR